MEGGTIQRLATYVQPKKAATTSMKAPSAIIPPLNEEEMSDSIIDIPSQKTVMYPDEVRENLRTALVDGGVAIPLIRLLSDENIHVQITASATLCNIVLDFSPMKKTVLENHGVERLVSLVHSSEPNLRLNSVWALKNLLYLADSEVKATVMASLTWEGLRNLINDNEICIQEQALSLLRNLACKKQSDIDDVFNGLNEDVLMSVLESKLDWVLRHLESPQANIPANAIDDIALHALYVITTQELLRAMEEDVDFDVRGRVRNALINFGDARPGTAVLESTGEMASSNESGSGVGNTMGDSSMEAGDNFSS
ncbi:Armadillo repeat-containing protein 8, partial [Phlyctochytrium bullatum]